MSDELRHAAERLYEYVTREIDDFTDEAAELDEEMGEELRQVLRDTLKLARTYLADHPADGVSDRDRLVRDNDILRASLANGAGPCIYCDLPKAEWSKCRHGFPGCGRADDAMLCPHFGAALQLDALNPADGDELIDEKWLREIGFRESERPYGYVLRIALKWKIATNPTYLVLADPPNITESPWELVSELGDGETEGTMIAEQITTRNELRLLLAALGVDKC